ncbi:MAG: 1,4-alpha-glucan branching protein GlgB [Pseudomonadota bacterium]
MTDLTARDPLALIPDTDKERLANGRHDDPFSVLGPHQRAGERHVTAYLPGASEVVAESGGTSHRLAHNAAWPGLFSGPVPGRAAYTLSATFAAVSHRFEDPYRFGPVIGEQDEYFLGEGTHQHIWRVLGAHVMVRDGVAGTHFAVWAPNAGRVSVVGAFNTWDGRRHPMRRRGATGVWEIFLPGIGEGEAYKYELVGPSGEVLPLKADPVGFGSEHPPANASVVRDISGYGWDDGAWMGARAAKNARTAPISIYEVHLGSWTRKEGGRRISYKEAAEELVAYAADMGFTHLEFLPLSEFPFDGSWGYQPVGLFAPTIRHGPPHEFRDLVEAAHKAGLGVILDWVPGHFPTDAHGLGRFDGTALYEHADAREGFHQDWNTYIYNFGRREVENFLTSNALYWLEEYHVDGLRVDAVASMLYRDYSREEGQWIPNKDGGRENYEAIAMLQRMNTTVYGEAEGILTAAEESTSFPGVSQPVDAGGLGFGYKWNMGWMNDTLVYMGKSPIHRKHHHHQMTFGLVYAFSENFILPISHDEVVHGKGSLYERMPGSHEDRLGNMRAYFGFMWGHPGKKLLFMGQEFGQKEEWNQEQSLPWELLQDPGHAGLRRLVRDLNTLYRGEAALHFKDTDPDGFQWIEADDADHSVFAWLRRGGPEDREMVVVVNFTPIERAQYRLNLPLKGRWREALNTDAAIYGGGDRGNMGGIDAQRPGAHGFAASADLYLPPLSALFLVHDG